ncbi:PQQ-binding-like beta-propeller repeat protein [Thermococcus sp.]|uniref:outer membrane protein assembly factor BamB family protein n=1 Tax=Thermococcus sp. TaxID=35749 RepID=UPI0026395FF2|nr:PQQ-binding-like beta-propeller repeat protein [Thermococcus sp.]
MKRGVSVILMTLLALSVLGTVLAAKNPVLWKGSVCSNVKYQKSIEAVAISNGRVYVGCSYREVANASGMIEIYYQGRLAAYSSNGTRLWQNDSGYVVKLYPLRDGKILVGSFGGFITFGRNGRFLSRNLTINKLYDFQVVGGKVYAVDGGVFIQNNSIHYIGHLYAGRIVNDSVILGRPITNFTSMTSRVRVGKGIIYVGAGFPSGYVGPSQFGYIYGVLPNGTIKWSINTGSWVRDMELLNGDLIAGTGYGKSNGWLYRVSPSGKILWKKVLFYTEDIDVAEGKIFVGGMGDEGGVLAAVDPQTGKVLWEKDFPYRVKVVRYADGKLLVGVGKFQSVNQNGSSIVYSVGSLYAVSPSDGKVLGELPNIGYVRSIAVEGNTAVVGTASSNFYVVDVKALAGESGEKGICGPAFVVVLALLPLLWKRR